VFEKSRGPGGRMATRRAGSFVFDHGAQYLTLRDPRLAGMREAWARSGIIAPWQAGACPAQTRWVAVPGMNALARHLLDGLAVDWNRTVTALAREGGRWRLIDLAGRPTDGFDCVLVAVPAPQAAALLGGCGGWDAELSAVEMAPCWAVMAADLPARPAAPVLWRESSPGAAGPLAWFAHDGGKPGRPGTGTWVLHAGEAYSRRYLEEPPEGVAETLWAAFARQVGLPAAQRPGHLVAHRWRYARVLSPLGRDCLWAPSLGLGACGDWCLGGRVEAALLSGSALAGRVMADASGTV
jgi:renalase